MKHPHLALQIIGRAMFLGLLAGMVLGAVYGALLPWYEPLTAIVAERPGVTLLLELPSLIIVMLLYGVLWGAFAGGIGAVFGLGFGLVNGVVMSLFTMVAEHSRSRLYQYGVQSVSGITTLAGALTIMYLLGGGLNEPYEWAFVGVPALCTLPAACWASRRVVQWLATQPQLG